MVDLLMLHRKTKIDELIDSVPIPANAVPINALPGWDSLPLSCKLPMLHCPANSIIFTRNRLGRKLDNSPAIKFRLSDAFNQSKYEPLHDPHLRKCLYKDQQLHLLEQQGQITDHKDVICSLKEFNEYRRYLNQTRLELVNRERERLEALAEDRKLFQKAQEITEYNFRKKMVFVARQIDHEEMQADTRQLLIEKQEKKNKRFVDRMVEQENIQKMKREVGELKALLFRERLEQVREARRLKIANLKHKMRLRDSHRIRRMIKRRQKIAEQKADEEIRQWCNMVQKRHEQHIYNENLLSKYEDDMKNRIALRIQKNGVIRERVQHKILQTKVNLIRSRYENKKLKRLIQVVTEEIHRKVRREKREQALFKLHDSSERAGLSPIVAPYRTPAESEYGLGDAPSGYSAIDDATIKQVVAACSQNETILNGKNYTTMAVLVTTKSIFDRLATGFTDDLPNDPDVLKLALIVVDMVISRVKEFVFSTMVNMIKQSRMPDSEITSKIKSTCTINRTNKSSKLSNIISFKERVSEKMSKSKILVLEKMAPLRTMVRSVLETPPLHDDLPIPRQLDDPKLFHLARQQKLLIVRNLHNLEIMLRARLEQNVVARFELSSLTIKGCKKKFPVNNCLDDESSEEVYNDLMGRAMTSVLTKPELDVEYPTNVLELSDFLTKKILLELQDYIDHGGDEDGEGEGGEEEGTDIEMKPDTNDDIPSELEDETEDESITP